MASVWYLGPMSQRTITAAQWSAAGIGGVDSVAWTSANGYSIPTTEFTGPQLVLLDDHAEFDISAPDGPRDIPFAGPDPNPWPQYVTEEELDPKVTALLDDEAGAQLLVRIIDLIIEHGGGGGGGGVTDHGALDGLADDDHTQYMNESRGDARYALLDHTHPAYALAADVATALAGKASTAHSHSTGTTSAAGFLELATELEAIEGLSTALAVTPAGLHAAVDDILTSALSNLAPAAHTHPMTQISDWEAYRIANNIPTVEVYETSPGAVGNAKLWFIEDVVAPPSQGVELVTHQFDTTNAASWNFTPDNLLDTFPDADYFLAFVDTAHATVTPANDADTLTGGGMTWAAEGSPISQGVLTSVVFRSTSGTPDGSDLVVGATGGTEGCSIQVVAVTELPFIDDFKGGTGTNNISLAVTGADSTHRIISHIAMNTGSATITADPGDPLGTPDITMTTPSIRSRCSVVDPGATPISYTISVSTAKTVIAVLVGPE